MDIFGENNGPTPTMIFEIIRELREIGKLFLWDNSNKWKKSGMARSKNVGVSFVSTGRENCWNFGTSTNSIVLLYWAQLLNGNFHEAGRAPLKGAWPRRAPACSRLRNAHGRFTQRLGCGQRIIFLRSTFHQQQKQGNFCCGDGQDPRYFSHPSAENGFYKGRLYQKKILGRYFLWWQGLIVYWESPMERLLTQTWAQLALVTQHNFGRRLPPSSHSIFHIFHRILCFLG